MTDLMDRTQGRIKLDVDHIRLDYPGSGGKTVRAIDDVSMAVEENGFSVIVGPSGCGKSSLLYLIAGLNQPSGGALRLDGRDIQGPGPDRGMVFQAYTLFPWLRVWQNVEFGLKRRGMPAPERRRIVDGYLSEVGLADFADAYPRQLSGGMKQRVAIARALANDPEILLMDEPFGALDSQTRSSMQRLLLRVWEQHKKTVLFVTHDIDEAILLGDHVYVMSSRPGRIKELIDIDLPRPRHMDMVLEPRFIALKRQILDLLRDEGDDEH